jgi:hypothetical protein
VQAKSKTKNVTFLPVDRAIAQCRVRAHQIEIQETKKAQPAHESRKIAKEKFAGNLSDANFSSTQPTGTISQKEAQSEKQNQMLKPSNLVVFFAAAFVFAGIGENYSLPNRLSRAAFL